MLCAWLKASRLASQFYLALSLLLGQARAFHQTGNLDWTIFVLVQLFGLFDQLYIVYANDYADIDTDRDNRTFTIFSGGSRVLVERSLQPEHLKRASVVMAAFCFGCAMVLTIGYGRVLAVPVVMLSLALLWIYSYPPLRLNYRGGGEVLQMLGLGGVLPVFGFYAQVGDLSDFPWSLLWVLAPTQLACALATALPDEPSDRASGKHTVAVLVGPQWTKLLIVGLNFFSIAAFMLWRGERLLAWNGYLFVAILIMANLAQLLLHDDQPGTFALSLRVFLAVLVTLSLMSLIIGVFLLEP
jgi:1,4-dihydroxy-2-naphthoate polyprenyltransferase